MDPAASAQSPQTARAALPGSAGTPGTAEGADFSGVLLLLLGIGTPAPIPQGSSSPAELPGQSGAHADAGDDGDEPGGDQSIPAGMIVPLALPLPLLAPVPAAPATGAAGDAPVPGSATATPAPLATDLAPVAAIGLDPGAGPSPASGAATAGGTPASPGLSVAGAARLAPATPPSGAPAADVSGTAVLPEAGVTPREAMGGPTAKPAAPERPMAPATVPATTPALDAPEPSRPASRASVPEPVVATGAAASADPEGPIRLPHGLAASLQTTTTGPQAAVSQPAPPAMPPPIPSQGPVDAVASAPVASAAQGQGTPPTRVPGEVADEMGPRPASGTATAALPASPVAGSIETRAGGQGRRETAPARRVAGGAPPSREVAPAATDGDRAMPWGLAVTASAPPRGEGDPRPQAGWGDATSARPETANMAAAAAVAGPPAPGATATPETAPASPAPRPEAPAVPDQVVQAARIVIADGLTRMDVRLDPPSLGGIRVTASTGSDGIGLTIAADRPETRALLVQALPEIQALLTDRGVATASVAVAPTFDPPTERRAPARRDAERGDRRHDTPTDRRPAAPARRRVGAVDLTV